MRYKLSTCYLLSPWLPNIQEQVAQFKSTELANNMPISIQVQLMEMKIFENIEHQLMDAEQHYIPIKGCDCRIFNNKFKMSSTKLNAKVELYTSKEKE
ncbi:unnamed protein product [Rhizophagus irregularis]|nr:unnamed protein product [Rhizophagus irregularis]